MCIIKPTVNPCAVADFAEFGFTLFQSLHHAAAASVAVGHFTPGHSPGHIMHPRTFSLPDNCPSNLGYFAPAVKTGTDPYS